MQMGIFIEFDKRKRRKIALKCDVRVSLKILIFALTSKPNPSPWVASAISPRGLALLDLASSTVVEEDCKKRSWRQR